MGKLINKNILSVLILIISFVIGLISLNYLPDIIVTHWGFYGEPNGYSSKAFGVLMFPVLILVLLLLFNFLPHTDPYQKNFLQFEKYFRTFICIILGFLLYLQIIIIAWNIKPDFNLVSFLVPGFSLLFYYTGFLLAKTKRNWFVGIRTPWAMADDDNWAKTHQLGSKLFKAVAILSLIGIIFPRLSFYFVFVPIIGSTLAVYLYSYLLHLQKHN